MTTYKVWIHVEEVDEEEGDYREVGEPIEVADVATQDEASNIANYLVEAAEKY